MKRVRPKKFLGQHFLKDLQIAQDIADTVDTVPQLPILEVGPGTGVLTGASIVAGTSTDCLMIGISMGATFHKGISRVGIIAEMTSDATR